MDEYEKIYGIDASTVTGLVAFAAADESIDSGAPRRIWQYRVTWKDFEGDSWQLMKTGERANVGNGCLRKEVVVAQVQCRIEERNSDWFAWTRTQHTRIPAYSYWNQSTIFAAEQPIQ